SCTRAVYDCLYTYFLYCCIFYFFFSSRRRHTRCYRDWSSDVCSSDLLELALRARRSREHVRVAVALARGTFERPDLESSQPPQPGIGDRSLNAGEEQLLRARAQEVNRSMDARLQQATCGGIGDAGQVGQP